MHVYIIITNFRKIGSKTLLIYLTNFFNLRNSFT